MRSHCQSLLTVRAPRGTVQGCRIRQLYRSFICKLDPANPEHQAMALTAAELTVAAEDARARLLAGDLTAEQPTVRLENSARRPGSISVAELRQLTTPTTGSSARGSRSDRRGTQPCRS